MYNVHVVQNRYRYSYYRQFSVTYRNICFACLCMYLELNNVSRERHVGFIYAHRPKLICESNMNIALVFIYLEFARLFSSRIRD